MPSLTVGELKEILESFQDQDEVLVAQGDQDTTANIFAVQGYARTELKRGVHLELLIDTAPIATMSGSDPERM